jgi:methionine aminopeptidase
MFSKVAAIFGCNVVQAVLSHQMKRFVIDGNKVIISKSDAENKVEEQELEVGEVYAIDVVMSTAEVSLLKFDDFNFQYHLSSPPQSTLIDIIRSY